MTQRCPGGQHYLHIAVLTCREWRGSSVGSCRRRRQAGSRGCTRDRGLGKEKNPTAAQPQPQQTQ